MITFRDVESEADRTLVASWYSLEWNIGEEETVGRLSAVPNDQVCFQRILMENGVPIGTGGLYFQVGIQKHVERYRTISPWIGLMYTLPERRGHGLGQLLLSDIEQQSRTRGYGRIYLFTHSAEALYRRNGWRTIEDLKNGSKVISVMEKLV